MGRIFRVLLLLTGLALLIAHFGGNATAFAVALALGGLAISLAAQDTIADAIAGFIIQIEGEDTWGDVVDTGLRTTRIRTRDNDLEKRSKFCTTRWVIGR